MAIRSFIKSVVLLLALNAGTAHALGTFIPAPGRVDMAYDEKRDIVYITSGGDLLRYNVSTGSFLPAVMVGGSLRGVDLSPDGDTLAVADSDFSSTHLWVRLVDLDTLSHSRLQTPREGNMESGTWAVSYAYDGSLLATTGFLGSGWTPMRRFNVDTGAVTVIAGVRQNTMVSASGDRRSIAFAESNSSDGPWGKYQPATGEFVRREWYENGTSRFNFEIATNANGSQYAIPTYGGTFVYNSAYAKIATFGTYAGPQPIGVAYHPVDSLAYFPWAETSEVKVYDMNALAPVGSYDFEYEFGHGGNDAYNEGRTKLSGDGSLLMVTVEGGVRILRMYAPLKADPVHVPWTSRYKIPLKGSVGNGGRVRYEIVRQPLHGRVTVNRGVATYWRTGGGARADSFVYRARYGRAVADAVVTITP